MGTTDESALIDEQSSLKKKVSRRLSDRELIAGQFLPPALFILISTGLPVFLLFLWSFWSYDTQAGQFVTEFTLANYSAFFDEARYTAIIRTLRIAVVVVVLTNVVAYPAAYTVYRFVNENNQLPVLMILVIPFIINRMLRIWSLTWLLSNRGGINQLLPFEDPIQWWLYTDSSVYMGLVIDTLPIAIMLIWLSLGRVDKTLLNASYDLGASPLQTFRKVTLPLTKTGLAASSILIFIFVMGSTSIPSFMGGPSMQTTGSMISSLFSVLQLPLAGVVATITVIVIMTILVVGEYFFDILTLFEEVES